MIKELKLSNFRLFGNEVTVRFRPITILIGKNNSGKSSIIKFLMMLKQSTTDTRSFLTTSGREVDLGVFYELKNKNKRLKDLTFSLKVDGHSSPDRYSSQFFKRHDIQDIEREYEIEVMIQYDKKNVFSGKQKIDLLGGGKRFLRGSSDISPESPFLYSLYESIKTEELDPKNEPIDEVVLDSVMRKCIEKLTGDIQSLEHLAAAREELEGFAPMYYSYPNKYVGKMGEDTVFQLWREKILENKKKKELLIKHAKKVLNIEDITIKELENQFAACSAIHEMGKAKVNLSCFGFGVSQCMPVFVQGLLMKHYSQLIVEQPEAQIHPTAQIEMGSFFVDLWKERKVGSIIETHSENILLRIRKHIVKRDISPEDVSIAYFNYDKKIPTVTNLTIKDDGTIQEGLPMKFFSANLKEVLDMGAYDHEDE